jgi:hypothetical protein
MTIRENTMNLINAIQAGDALEMESAFNAAMAEKVSEKLDGMRGEVSQNMFKTLEQSVEDTTTSEE